MAVGVGGAADQQSRGAAGQAVLVVIDAASGRPEAVAGAGTRPAWFAALTDRDPAAAHGCPGGSTARLPLGVLTRDEQAYTVGRHPVPGTGQAHTSVDLILSTVRAVNHADPGLYGGCVQQDCFPAPTRLGDRRNGARSPGQNRGLPARVRLISIGLPAQAGQAVLPHQRPRQPGRRMRRGPRPDRQAARPGATVWVTLAKRPRD